jgi:hypothetical protein
MDVACGGLEDFGGEVASLTRPKRILAGAKMKNDFEWDHASIAMLRELWESGKSSAQIGLTMGLSKNAVIGKAHRLKLCGRPSPIKPAARDPDGSRKWLTRKNRRPKQIAHEEKHTLHLLTSVAPVEPLEGGSAPRREPSPSSIVFTPPTPHIIARAGKCQWLFGQRRAWRACDAPTVGGTSWCQVHRLRCCHTNATTDRPAIPTSANAPSQPGADAGDGGDAAR